MGVRNAVITDVIKEDNKNTYKVMVYAFDPRKNEWHFENGKISEDKLLNAAYSGKIELKNAGIATDGTKRLIGTCGSIDRFTNSIKYGLKPWIIIAELRIKGTNRLIGYKIINNNSEIKNVKLIDILSYCSKVTTKAKMNNIPVVPIQNAMYIEASDNVSAHIRPYTDNQFIIQFFEVKKPENAAPANVNTKANEKKMAIMDLYTKSQIQQLRLGKEHGVDIRIYGNPKLSAEQMKEIRLALEDGLNPRAYADPAFKVDCMKIYRLQSKYGVNLREFINPEYNVAQILEISTAYLDGLDYAKIADPKKSATDMAKERIEMEIEMYTTNSASALKL